MSEWALADFTDVTLVSDDTFTEDEEDEEDKDDEEDKEDEEDEEDEIAKEVKRSDGLWRFACGDVLIQTKVYGYPAELSLP